MLEIKNLSKCFGNKEIFKNFSLTLPDTGVFILFGDSGIGKTTLLRIIAGLDSDFDGEIIGGGIKNTAFAFQEHRLFPTLSAIDNLIFANHDKKNDANAREAEKALNSLGFNVNDYYLFPSELSGGMKQRISVARALLRNRPILLLDEPTKELDEENALRMLDLIKSEAQKRLVIVVSHNKYDIEYLNADIIKI